MKQYLKNCFLAYLCLYRSKSYGIRKRVVDHPQRNRAGEDSPPVPRWGRTDIRYSLKRVIANYLYPVDSCPAYVRLRGLTYLGANYPRTLNKIQWLASLALTLRIMLDMLQESFFVASLRSAKIRVKRLVIRHSLRDGSRHVCLPSYIKPRRLKGLGLILILSYTSCQAQETEVQKEVLEAPVLIYGEILSNQGVDTLNLMVYEDYLGKMVSLPEPEKYSKIIKSGDGHYGLPGQLAFSITTKPISDYSYASLFSKTHFNLFSNYLISPWDTVGIFLDRLNNKLVFTGPSALKYKVQRELDETFTEELAAGPAYLAVNDMDDFLERRAGQKSPEYGIRSFEPYPKEEALARYEERLSKDISNHPGFEIIESYKGTLDDDFLEILRLNHLGRLLFSKVFHFNVIQKPDRKEWSALMLKHSKDMPGVAENSKLLFYAPFYSDYLVEKYLAESYSERSNALDKVLAIEDSQFRDWMLAKFIIRFYPVISNKEEYIRRAHEVMKDSTALQVFNNYLAGRRKGTAVPDFTLANAEDEEVKLNDFRGRVVFLDFWFTGCQACVMFNRNILTPVEEYFSGNEDVVFLGISIDSDKSKWLKSVDSGKYAPHETIHLYTEGKGMDHPILKFFTIHGFPSQVLLDKEGKIVETTGFKGDPETVIQLISDTINQKP